ncbi:ribonucleotide reductase [Mycena alexandri]|uniref:Ribonucleoside-diphosphate reductase n=1 Tax=Mycena alexandri TaxID=1745969 RepID=A0AAD6X8J0_9AGAR|nr:ribonucleotide reductase [Mycena alexandri]
MMIVKRLNTTTFGIDPRQVDVQRLVDVVDAQMIAGRTTAHINVELAIQAALKASDINPAYLWIAAHLAVAELHKTVNPRFSDSVRRISDGASQDVVDEDFIDVVKNHGQVLDSAIVHMRDYDLTYDMLKNLEQRSLGRSGSQISERPQHMYMRMALAMHLSEIPRVQATYELLSSRLVVHDSYVSVFSGTTELVRSSSCSISVSDSDVKELYDAVAKCVFAVRRGGTVAISAQGIACAGRNAICHHRESSVGMWTMLKFLEVAISFARCAHDKRADVVNVCLEPWHIDIRSVVEFNNMHRHELADQRSITITLSLPDIFMARVDEDSDWSLFCPKDVPDLLRLKGHHFETAYTQYESSSVHRVTVRARELWNLMLRSQIITGGPSVIFRDNINGKSNLTETPASCHADLQDGTVDLLADDDQLHPRNRASIALPLFVTRDAVFDFEKLHQVVKETVCNLNRILDASIPRLEASMDRNQEFRAISIGIHGLADVFTALRLAYESPEAAALNVRIAETMYHGALESSCDLAEQFGPYAAFARSPLANGIFQYDFWDVTPSDHFDWDHLHSRIRASGVRNATLIAVGPGMLEDTPTGFTQSTDPFTSNVLADGVICPWLVQELVGLGLWNEVTRSVQQIPLLPDEVKAIYRTAWEIDPKNVLKLALDRAPFTCNTQGLSLHLESPDVDRLGELMMRAWSMGDSSFDEEDTDREMSFDDVILSSSSS